MKLPLKLLLLVILFLTAGFLFGVIVHELFGEQDDVLDQITSGFIERNIESDQLTEIMRVITFFASAKFLFAAYSILVLWFWLIMKNNMLALNVAVIAVTSFLLTTLFKKTFQTIRPLDPLIEPLENYSFPSGHASIGFILYGLLAYLVWKSSIKLIYRRIIAASLILFSVIIAISRIYLRIHHTSDVIAGLCLGIAWLAISVWLLRLKSDQPKYSATD